MSSIFNNLLKKVKLKKKLDNYFVQDEYAFSLEEIESIEEENHKKIKDLKKNTIGIKEKEEVIITNVDNNEIVNEELSFDVEKKEILDEEKLTEVEEAQIEEYLEEITKDDEVEENSDSFINLSEKNQKLIMDSWNLIDLQEIDKYILNGKDILNHNYNITYGDDALRFVHDIRKKYEIVICYLIGFNNEKKGIENKTIFSDKLDNEWKYLENYIKVLEKIRNFRK